MADGVFSETRKMLKKEFFTSSKTNGVTEGFRRLSVLSGGVGFYWVFMALIESSSSIAIYISDYLGITGILADLVMALIASASGVLAFFVVAFAVRVIGWVLEGFVK